MINLSINFLDPGDNQTALPYVTALQFGTEEAAWAYDEAAAAPQDATRALDRMYEVMQELRHLSLSIGHLRVAGICERICSLIDLAASDLLDSLLIQLKALRRIVVAALQGGGAFCRV